MFILWSCYMESHMYSLWAQHTGTTELHSDAYHCSCHNIWEEGSLFLCLSEQMSKAALMWICTAVFMLITESHREDNRTNIGWKMVPSFVSYWKNCESSTASHLGFMSTVWCMISGGEPVQWGAIKDPSALIWSHPKWFIKWYWWPKEVLGRKPKPQAFPPSVPTSHSHFGDEKESPLAGDMLQWLSQLHFLPVR